MMNRMIVGAISGAILGVIEMFVFDGGMDLIVFPALLGVLIGFMSTKINTSFGVLGVGVIVGAVFFLISALMTGMKMLDHTIVGAVTGLIIGFFFQMVAPKIKFLNESQA